jgi:hypothetical protein
MANIESRIQKSIIEVLQCSGYWCWRNNSGNMVVGEGESRRFIRMAPKGSPDIIGILPGYGRFFGLEVKVPGKKQSTGQCEWEARARNFGARYAVVTSASEALSTLANWKREEFVP